MEELITQINQICARKGRCIVAIDGRCAAGKTTLANALAQRLGANLFHADHFFLQPEQRTPQRLAQPGGNLDVERLEQEVLIPLAEGRPVCYRPYDCGTQSLGTPLTVEPKPISIVEGSYSLHPRLEGYYDLKLLLEISPAEQKQRLLARDPQKYEQFLTRWIPLEEAYFEQTNITQRCDERRTL